MYQYKDGIMNVAIILGHITTVYYSEGADTFEVYLTDKGEPNEVPTKYYYDFMNMLKSYVKIQAQ